jgi:L-alanine-DL-glutamate epimerase-like enolase superfamily enzyme
MNLSRLTIKKIKIPFKVSFKHSSATRAATQSIWVEATSDSGLVGYGEGCPREYVTHESIETAFRFFAENHADVVVRARDLEGVRTWSQANKEKIDANPAAWCAMELALLDLIAKEQRCAIEKLLGLPEINSPFQYSAVLGDSELDAFEKQLHQYIAMGFADLKIKISGNPDKDLPKFDLLTKLENKDFRVRLDANNVWKNWQDAVDYLSLIRYPLFAIEEPLESGQYDGLRKISEARNIKIILDESFLRLEDFQKISGNASGWIINLRVSKMGGLLRSLAIAETARRARIKIIVGAQVGETSLLTRSALTVAHAYKDIVVAQEGAFGTLLLQSDVCEPPLMFGKKGKLDFKPVQEHGFQLQISESLYESGVLESADKL